MSPQLEKLVAQITADKKKLGIMVCLLTVALLLWGRLMLKNVPKTATASPPTAATPPLPWEDGWDGAAQDASDTTQSHDRGMTVVVDMPTNLTRDVFMLNKDGYRVVESDAPKEIEEKTETDAPDKAFVIAQVKQAARDLRLDGVVLGDEPGVIINGELLQVGQTIDGFTVVRIKDRQVVLEMDGVHIRMGM